MWLETNLYHICKPPCRYSPTLFSALYLITNLLQLPNLVAVGITSDVLLCDHSANKGRASHLEATSVCSQTVLYRKKGLFLRGKISCSTKYV